MLTIGICDDHVEIIDDLVEQLENWAAIQGLALQVRTYTRGSDLLEDYQGIDLLFLDMKMPEGDGGPIAREIKRENPLLPIVFITAFTQYMRMALDIHAFGFLDKPIAEKAVYDIMSDFLHYQEAQVGEALAFKTKDGLRMIFPKDILYFERQHRAIYLVMPEEQLWINIPTLAEVMDQMADHGFYQIHRSYIVSLKHIVRIQREAVLLENGVSLPLAKGRAAAFRQVYVGQMEKGW